LYNSLGELLNGLTIKPRCVYGDSVTKDTPVLIRRYINGEEKVFIERIDKLNGEWKAYNEFKPQDSISSNRRYKQQNLENINFDIWSDKGWTKVKRVIRHKCNKRIFRVLTQKGSVDVTEDHSLLDINGKIIKPSQCKIGTKLLHSELPSINNHDEINVHNKYNKLYIYGFFMRNGNCEIRNTKFGIEYVWELINLNYELLVKLKKCLDKIYPHNNFKISKCDNAYKLISQKWSKKYTEWNNK